MIDDLDTYLQPTLAHYRAGRIDDAASSLDGVIDNIDALDEFDAAYNAIWDRVGALLGARAESVLLIYLNELYRERQRDSVELS